MLNLLGSHDTDRLSTLLADDPHKLKLAYAILYAYPGAPCIYYGDEIGLAGGRDPACRAAFPWGPETWNSDLRAWIQKLIALRKRLAPLRRGDFQRLLLDSDQSCYAFIRSSREHHVVIALNASTEVRELSIPLSDSGLSVAQPLHDLLGINTPDNHAIQLSDQVLYVKLPAWGIAWIGSQPL
jgi:neopullulanase